MRVAALAITLVRRNRKGVVVRYEAEPSDILDDEGWSYSDDDPDTGMTAIGKDDDLAAYYNDEAEDEELHRLLLELRSEFEGRDDEASKSILKSVEGCEEYLRNSKVGAIDARAALAFAATDTEHYFEHSIDLMESSLGVLDDKGGLYDDYEDDDEPLVEADDEAYGSLLGNVTEDASVVEGHFGGSVAVGVDLGTTNSAVGVVVDGAPVIVPPGLRPSVVCFVDTGLDEEAYVSDDNVGSVALTEDDEDGRVFAVVGTDAERMRGGAHGASICSRVKRIMGRDATAAERRRVGAFRTKGGKETQSEVTLAIPSLGHRIGAIDVSAEIVRQLRHDADHFLGLGARATRAVVGVPARFDEAAREATLTSAILGGFDDVRLLTEPEAAALAFGAARARKRQTGNTTILVFDLGGGTFDASVVAVSDNEATLLSVGGDAKLGGDDFDAALAQLLAKRFYDLHGVAIKAPSARLRLLAEAERCKRELSKNTTVNARARCLARVDLDGARSRHGRPIDLDETVDRKTFERICKPLLRDVEESARAVCTEANVRLPERKRRGRKKQDDETPPVEEAESSGSDDLLELDAVLLVGGATRMPAIGRMLKRLTGLPLSRIVANDGLNPDEAVALGCAIQAATLDQRYGFRSDTLEAPFALASRR